MLFLTKYYSLTIKGTLKLFTTSNFVLRIGEKKIVEKEHGLENPS